MTEITIKKLEKKFESELGKEGFYKELRKFTRDKFDNLEELKNSFTNKDKATIYMILAKKYIIDIISL